MGINSWLLLGRLRRAVKKISFLLNFNINRWRIASTIGASSSNHRRLSHSFNDRPGLRDCTDDLNTYYDSPGSSRGGGGRGGGISRTSSCPSEDDIDKRAEMFIANFYRQLQIERQVSLELRYCRANSLESASP
ncbi:unnamed protein product [Camellia sinensis]